MEGGASSSSGSSGGTRPVVGRREIVFAELGLSVKLSHPTTLLIPITPEGVMKAEILVLRRLQKFQCKLTKLLTLMCKRPMPISPWHRNGCKAHWRTLKKTCLTSARGLIRNADHWCRNVSRSNAAAISRSCAPRLMVWCRSWRSPPSAAWWKPHKP